jgi:hypothetical protein
LIKSALGRSEKIELEKAFLLVQSLKKGEQKIHEDAFLLKKNAEEALDKLTTFESALEEREEHAAQMLKVAAERKKKRKAAVLDNIKIEQAPQNAMYLAEGGSGFGGGYYDVGSGNASMSLGMGGFR